MNTAVAILFVIGVFGIAAAIYQFKANHLIEANHVRELDAYKKVGGWYEKRVEELEAETRNLAQQIVDSLGHPAVAMPAWPNQPDEEYAYDATGIIRERLDPRDVG